VIAILWSLQEQNEFLVPPEGPGWMAQTACAAWAGLPKRFVLLCWHGQFVRSQFKHLVVSHPKNAHHVQLSQEKRRSSKCNYYIVSPTVILGS